MARLNSRKALKNIGKPGANGFESFALSALPQRAEADSSESALHRREGDLSGRVIDVEMPSGATGSETVVSEGWQSGHDTLEAKGDIRV